MEIPKIDDELMIKQLADFIVDEAIPNGIDRRLAHDDRDTSDKFCLVTWFVILPKDVTKDELQFLCASRKVWQYPIIDVHVHQKSVAILACESAANMAEAKVLSEAYGDAKILKIDGTPLDA